MSGADEAEATRRFTLAVDYIRTLPSDGPVTLSNTSKLYLYGLFKQGQEGDCSVPKPSMFDPFGRAKWQAWSSMAGKAKAECLAEYVDVVVETVRGMDSAALSPEHLRMRDEFLASLEPQGQAEAEEEEEEEKAEPAPAPALERARADEGKHETPRTPRRDELETAAAATTPQRAGGGADGEDDARAHLASLEARLSEMMRRVAETSGSAASLEQIGPFRDELRRLVETMDERARRKQAEYEEAERAWQEQLDEVKLLQRQLLSKLRQHGIEGASPSAPNAGPAARRGSAHPWLWLLFRMVKAGVPLGVAGYVFYQYLQRRKLARR